MMANEMFSALLSSPSRHLSLAGEMELLTGACLSFSGEQALSFSMSEGANDGMLLGGAFSASCTLVLHDGRDAFTGLSFQGARVQVYLCAGEHRAPLSCFFVTAVSRQPERKQWQLKGCDALGLAFDAPFTDDFSYPLSLGEMAARIASRAGYTLEINFPNGTVQISRPPLWGEITLRQALGYTAGAMGCFAMMDRKGQLVFRSAWTKNISRPIPAAQMLRIHQGEQAFGPLTALSIDLKGAPKDEGPWIIRIGEEMAEKDGCLSLSGNPLFAWQMDHTESLGQGLLSVLQGMYLSPAQLAWRGNPDYLPGDRVILQLPSGESREVLITRQLLSFSHGFLMQSDCTIRENQPVGRIFTAAGALNAGKLSGNLDGGLISPESIAASSLMAGSITARQLAVAAVNAEKLAAGAIAARHIAAGAVEAEKIASDAIFARHLSADALDAASAHILKADIDWAEIESLQAAIAKITSAEIQNVDIDFAKIKDLNADTAIITKGNAGELYISRLAVTEANMVSLSVGKLLVKGADGAFYALSVDETGAIKAEKKLIENGDIRDVSIDAGQKIIEGSVTAATLNAREIFGESALIRELIATNLDVDALFAREATIAKINALDITGNESIRLYVKSQEEMSAYLRVTENGLEIGRVGDTATFRADNRTLEVTNVKTERLGIAQRMAQSDEWAVSAYQSGLSIKWIGGDA